MPYKLVKPVVDLGVRILCLRPYINHPKGCPNFNKKLGCPPHSRTIDKILNLEKPIYAIWNVFNFGQHCQKMKIKHPNWSQRQVECCLYWQQTARNQLGAELDKFKKRKPTFKILYPPESYGINVTATMKKIEEILEWPPKTKTYQVALAGIKL